MRGQACAFGNGTRPIPELQYQAVSRAVTGGEIAKRVWAELAVLMGWLG
jgi:hypothetical protein